MYEIEDDLLMVASDRISAYDVVLPTPIPDKGAVLTRMSVFWFETTGDICPNHMITADVPAEAEGRGLRVKKLEMYPVECVVRGYITGSGWKEYKSSARSAGSSCPRASRSRRSFPSRSSPRPPRPRSATTTRTSPSSAPSRRSATAALMEGLRDTSIALYEHAAAHALERGIIIADTKFEFGASPGAEIVLGDEVLTPDSSRFWPADDYEAGRGQSSFDKQYVRDWLDDSGWDHSPPGPELPDEIVQGTRAKYVEAYERITGRDF